MAEQNAEMTGKEAGAAPPICSGAMPGWAIDATAAMPPWVTPWSRKSFGNKSFGNKSFGKS
jgi:hypothetical protein